MRLVGGSLHQSAASVPKIENPTEAQSPFVAPKIDIDPDDYFHLLLTDPTNLTQRDMVIAMWCSNEDRTVKYLRANTGHEFGPISNQRTPVEILEEQLVFWKEFLAESKRLNEIQKSQIEAEQAVPSDGHKPSNSAPSSSTIAPADAH